MNIEIGQRIVVRKDEEYWDEPYRMKRHHTPKVRSVLLQGICKEINSNQFKLELSNNNGFEKDGETFVFSTLSVISEPLADISDKVGKWF